MSFALATENEVGPGAALSLLTGALVLGSELENSYHPLGFKTAIITPTVGAVELEIDLRTSAIRPVILIASNFIVGMLTLETRTGAGVPVQTFSVDPSFAQILQWAIRSIVVRPSIAFQKIHLTWALGAGNPTPFEIFHIWCAPTVTEIQAPDLPWTREFRAIEEVVAERGRPLSNVAALTHRAGARPFTLFRDINTLWINSSYGARPAALVENWHLFAPATVGTANTSGYVVDWSVDKPPSFAAVRPTSNSFDTSFEVVTPAAPRYPDDYEVTYL